MAKRKNKRYTKERRAQILAAAKKEGLTAKDVQKRFGVTPVTYYSWRKKRGGAVRRRRAPARGKSTGANLGNQLRGEVRARVRALIPGLVRSEVSAYLATLFNVERERRARK